MKQCGYDEYAIIVFINKNIIVTLNHNIIPFMENEIHIYMLVSQSPRSRQESYIHSSQMYNISIS